MEKLIELLNEYEKSKWYEWWWEIKNWIPYFDDGLPKTKEYISVLICAKPYGFIKRLVENDKIAWRKCLDLWYEIAVIDKEGEDVDIMRTFDDYEQLLMYLAIQDNPIEFLISILK